MILTLQELPPNVIGLEAFGKVTREDYELVIVPQIEAKLSQYGKIRLIYVLGADFEGYDLRAVWEDATLALKQPTSWERIAVVSDDENIRRIIAALGWLVPGDVKLFSLAQLQEARAWVSD